MGGHSAWRKRVASGELAKGMGGAIARHHPHLGRKGSDRILNRLGHIGVDGNPKRKNKKKRARSLRETSNGPNIDVSSRLRHGSVQPRGNAQSTVLARKLDHQGNYSFWRRLLLIVLLAYATTLAISLGWHRLARKQRAM